MQHFQHRTRDLPNAANASFRTRRQRARRNFTRSRGARKGTASLTRSRQNRQVLLAIAGSAALRGPPVVDGSLATMLRCRDARWWGSRGRRRSSEDSREAAENAKALHQKDLWTSPCATSRTRRRAASARRFFACSAARREIVTGSGSPWPFTLRLPHAFVAASRARADAWRARRLGVNTDSEESRATSVREISCPRSSACAPIS
jgi:hypothetical protein